MAVSRLERCIYTCIRNMDKSIATGTERGRPEAAEALMLYRLSVPSHISNTDS